jgi:hypothetical protein
MVPRAGYSGNNTWVLVSLDKLTLKSHVLAESFPRNARRRGPRDA